MNHRDTPPSDGRRAKIFLDPFATPDYRFLGERLLWLLYIGGYVVTLAFFSFIDVYDNHFFQADYSLPYNAFRVVFAAYFFWTIYAAGRSTLVWLAGARPVDGLPLHERLALGFFVGAVVLTIVMLVLGYLYLYWRAVAALITIPIVVASWPTFARTVAEAKAVIQDRWRATGWFERIALAPMVAAAIAAAAALLLVKGLYPQGGHDYFLHYFQFYSAVVDNHNLWPNLFWYQYYLSKGMGLMFLGMLLTDGLAPSLVSYCFALATALALFSLVRGFCPKTLWPWLAIVLYFAFNVHTLGVGIYSAHGGWGHFQKPHEVNAGFLIAVLWMSVNMVRSGPDIRRIWWLGAAACSFIIANILIVAPGIVGPFAVIAALVFVLVRREIAWAFLGLAVSAGLGTVFVLLLNYLTTGAPADIAAHIWWPIVDFRRLADWGVVYDFGWVAIVRAHASVNRALMPEGFSFIEFLVNFSRFDVLGSLIVYSLAAAVVLASIGTFLRYRFPGAVAGIGAANVAAGGVVLAFVASIAVFTLGAGLSEAISYIRITSFMLPLVIALAAIAWQVAIVTIRWPAALRGLLAIIVPLLLTWISVAQAYDRQKPTLTQVAANAVRFVDGRYSIYDSYRDQSGWPALPNSTAIYPPMYEAWKSIGPGKRIWSFHVHSYCMLPGCHVESLYSSHMSKNRTDVFYGPPEVARAVLQKEGLNYFFISTTLGVREMNHCAPLFAPDTLRDYFDVQWTDGTDALLTWKGQGTAPLSNEWVEKYREAIKPGTFQPSCTPEKPFFINFGHRLSEAIEKGNRWGAEMPALK